MAKGTDGLLLTASLNIEETANIIKKEDIAKLNNKLANDDTARVKIVGGLDLNKTQSLIQSQIATIGKNLKLNIGQIDTSGLNTALNNVQNKIVGTNNGLSIKPTIDGKIIEDTDILIKTIVTKLQTLNNIDLNGFKNNLKSLGFSGKDVTNATDELVQALKLTPENKDVIINSYQNLMDSIRNTIKNDKIVSDKNFDNRLAMSIYQAATEYKDLGEKAKQSAKETQTASKATIETTTKETQVVKAQIEAYDNLTLSKKTALTTASGEQISRTETFTNKATGKSQTVVYDEEDNASVIRYAENIDKVVVAQERANASAIKLETSYAKIKSRIEDLNSSKPIKDDTNKSKLVEQYNKVEQAIEAVRSADSSNLATMKANAEKEISALQNLERAYRNAENTAEQLRARDVTTIKTENIQKLAQFEAKIQGSKVPITEMRNDLNSLNMAINNIGTNDTEGLTKFLNQFDIAKAKFAALNQQLTTDNSMQRQAQNAELLVEKVKKLRSEIIAYQNANSKAMKSQATSSNGITYSAEIDGFLAKLKNASSVTDAEFKKISASFRTLKAEVKSAGLEGGTMLSSLWANAKKFTNWMGITMVTASIAREIRGMFTDVAELDEALIDLRKTFQGTSEDLQSFYYSANDVAKQLGVTTQEVINTASSWSRLGYSTAEAATKMAELSSMFASISPNMDIETATNGLVSIMKAFDVDVDNVKEKIMSSINEVGNTFAVSNGDIVEGLQLSSAAMASMGSSLEETISLFTAGKFHCLYVQKCA